MIRSAYGLLVLVAGTMLPGCYAGIAATVVALTQGSSSSGDTTLWQVTQVQVESREALELPPGCPAPAGGELFLEQIANEEGFAPYVSGAAVPIEFHLELNDPRGKPRTGARSEVVMEIRRDGGTETIRLGKFAEGLHRVAWDSTRYGPEAPTDVDIVVRPEPGGADQASTASVLADNRPQVPQASLVGITSPGCAEGLQGLLEVRFALGSADADGPGADFEADPTLYAEVEGRTSPVATLPPAGAGSPSPGGPGAELVLSWDTAQILPARSADAFLILCLEDRNARCRPGAFFLPCEPERFRINNSRPVVSNVRVSSSPQGVRESTQHLVGKVFIEYEATDRGSEACDLDLEVHLDDGENPIVVLSTSAANLSEALGPPSQGAVSLETSPEGVEHSFVWNSDPDIDSLVRAGRLSSPLVTRVTIKVSVKDRSSCLKFEPKDAVEVVLDNRLMHTVIGVVPGQTSPGRKTAERDSLTFETLVAVERSTDGATLYLVDSDAHLVWKMPLTEETDAVTRIIGDGSKRLNEDIEGLDGRVADSVTLDTPSDIAVVAAELRDAVYLLERSSLVWKLEGGALRQAFDGRKVLHRPESLAAEVIGGRTFLYIADTLNCRIIRHETGVEDSRTLAGLLETIEPEGDPELVAEAQRSGQPYPQTNGCNFRKDTSVVPSIDLARAIANEPSGLCLFRSASGRRTLIIADSKNSRILGIDLGPIAELDTFSPGPAMELLRRDAGHPVLSFLCEPRGLRAADGFLFITCVGVSFNGNRSKGIVLRVPLVEDQRGFPELGPPDSVEQIAGGLIVRNEPVAPQCSSSSDLNEAVTYNQVDECRPANEVPLSKPADVVTDPAGGVYVCDSRNQRLRKLDESCQEAAADPLGGGPPPAGRAGLRTFVGNGVEGRSEAEAFKDVCSPLSGAPSERLPATAFKLSQPLGMVVIDDALLIVSDRGNNRILEVDLGSGLVATVAGRLRTADDATLFSGDGGPATQALFNVPRSLAVHPARGFCEAPERKLFIADSLNHVVRVIDAGGTVNTFAGSRDPAADADLAPGVAAAPREVFLKLPRQLVVDSRGRLLIGDCRHRIVQVGTDGLLRRVIGVGAIDAERLGTCENLAGLDPGDPDFIDPKDPVSIGDGGLAIDARLNQPSEMAFDPAEMFLFIADQANGRVRRVEYDADQGSFGVIETVAGNGERNSTGRFPSEDQPTLATSFPVSNPLGVAADPSGQFLYFSEVFIPCRVYRLRLNDDPAQGTLTLLAGRDVQGAVGDGDKAFRAQLFNPSSVRLDSSGKVLYVVDGQNQRVRRFWVGP